METKPDLSHVNFDLKALSQRFISQVSAFICSRVVSLDLVGSRRRNQLTIPQYTEPQELACSFGYQHLLDIREVFLDRRVDRLVSYFELGSLVLVHHARI